VHFSLDTYLEPTRNRHGRPAWCVAHEALSVIMEDGISKKHILNVPQYSLLLVRNHQYVQAKQIIAEVRANTVPLKEKIEKDIYSHIDGEVFCEYKSIRSYCSKQRNLLQFPYSQTRLSVWLEFASFRNYLSPVLDTTSYIWIFSGRLSQFSGFNLSLFYKVQDYIQPELPIGKQNHIITQYESIVRSYKYRQCATYLYYCGPEFFFTSYTGFVYEVNEQEKWVLTLSSLDQFFLKKKNLNDYINTSSHYFYSQFLEGNSKYLYNHLLPHQQRKLTDRELYFLIYHASNFSNDIGLLGRLNALLAYSFVSCLRKFLQTIENHSNKRVIDKKHEQNQEMEKWFVSMGFMSLLWKVSLLYKLRKKKQTYLGQTICKGVAILGCGVVPDSGHILSISEHYIIIRLAKVYLIPAGTIIHGSHKQVIHEGDTLITFAYERLKASDIIQGLPKAEQLLEARIGNQVVVHLHMRFEYLVELLKEQLRNYVGSLTQIDLMLSQASVNRARRALEYSQIETVDQIQKVYLSQGVYISDKHVEVIVRQMSCKIVIVENTDLTAFSPKSVIRTSFPYDIIAIFFPGELIEISKAQRMSRVLQKPLPCKPVLLGITKASLNTSSFLSEASFERSITVLSKSALQGRMDWLKGLKENVLLSKIIPAGTGSKQVDVQAILYKNQKMNFQNKKDSLFTYTHDNILSLYKPLLSKRDWLHLYLTQFTQQKIHDKNKDLIFSYLKHGLLSIRKSREYSILSVNDFSKNRMYVVPK
jgi:hypothetical protein